MKVLCLIILTAFGSAYADDSSQDSKRKEIFLDKSLLQSFVEPNTKIEALAQESTRNATTFSFSHDFETRDRVYQIKEGRTNPFQDIDSSRNNFSNQTMQNGGRL